MSTIYKRERIRASELDRYETVPVHLCGRHCSHSFAEGEADSKNYYGPRSRKLTFAEQKVDFGKAERELDRMEEKFEADARAIFIAEKNNFRSSIMDAAAKNDFDRLKSIRYAAVTSIRDLVRENAVEAYELGKEMVSQEMKKKPPSRPNDTRRLIDVHADAIAWEQAGAIENKAKIELTSSLLRENTVAAAVAGVDLAMDKWIDSFVRQTGGIVMSGFMNIGRRRTMRAYSGDIYALQRSEVLDRRTCNYCLSIDGRIVDKDDPFARNDIFHTGCRGIWVEILNDEEQKPEIDGIPDSLRARFGGAVNDLIQPKTPITKKNSLSRQYVRRRRTR